MKSFRTNKGMNVIPEQIKEENQPIK